MVDRFDSASQLIDVLASEDDISSDPDDNPILAAADAAGVDVLCTRDRHFRQPAVLAFCEARRVRLATDIELLTELRRDDSN